MENHLAMKSNESFISVFGIDRIRRECQFYNWTLKFLACFYDQKNIKISTTWLCWWTQQNLQVKLHRSISLTNPLSINTNSRAHISRIGIYSVRRCPGKAIEPGVKPLAMCTSPYVWSFVREIRNCLSQLLWAREALERGRYCSLTTTRLDDDRRRDFND